MSDPRIPSLPRPLPPVQELRNALTVAIAHEQLIHRRLNHGSIVLDASTRASLQAIALALTKAKAVVQRLEP